MRVLSYSGTSGDCVEIEKATDLYPLLDWFKAKLIRLKADKDALKKLQIVMDCTETIGLGCEADVEKVRYI